MRLNRKNDMERSKRISCEPEIAFLRPEVNFRQTGNDFLKLFPNEILIDNSKCNNDFRLRPGTTK